MADPANLDDNDRNTLLQRALDLALAPVRILASRAAIKAYIGTILFLLASGVLLAISSTAYGFFYYSYIPPINLERVIYLQYGQSLYPFSTVELDTSALIAQQAYDVELILDMPRTPTNLDAGNFMLDLSLLGSRGAPDTFPSWLANITLENVLHHSRRPAILPYSSPILSLSHTLLHLPAHLLNFRDLDRSHLVVPMFEMVTFARGSRNVPTHARVELQSNTVLQVYAAKLAFRARFQGMRYLIYNYRVASFLVFTALFYTVSVTTMALAWAVVAHALAAGAGERGSAQSKKIKQEADVGKATPATKTDTELSTGLRVKMEDDETESSTHGGLSVSNISDTPTQFPTARGQPILRDPGRRRGGDHEDGSSRPDDELARPLGPDEAADDEDDDDDEVENDHALGAVKYEAEPRGRSFDGDSGLGTSMESEHASRGLVRRRSSRRGG